MTTERERFEAWAARNVGQPDFGGYHTDGGRWFYRHNFIRMCWDAWQAALDHARTAEPQRPLDDEGLALLRRVRSFVAVQCGGQFGSGPCVSAIDAYLAKPRKAHEPVAWMVYTQDGKSVFVTDNPTDIPPNCTALPLFTESKA